MEYFKSPLNSTQSTHSKWLTFHGTYFSYFELVYRIQHLQSRLSNCSFTNPTTQHCHKNEAPRLASALVLNKRTCSYRRCSPSKKGLQDKAWWGNQGGARRGVDKPNKRHVWAHHPSTPPGPGVSNCRERSPGLWPAPPGACRGQAPAILLSKFAVCHWKM